MSIVCLLSRSKIVWRLYCCSRVVGLYYDGNSGTWYTYDHQNQQYVPCTDQSSNKVPGESAKESSKASDGGGIKKVVISAPATTTRSNEQAKLPDAVQAAAAAALAAEKKEKEKLKEIKLASKSSLLANKKKMNNVLAIPDFTFD